MKITKILHLTDATLRNRWGAKLESQVHSSGGGSSLHNSPPRLNLEFNTFPFEGLIIVLIILLLTLHLGIFTILTTPDESTLGGILIEG
jgi:hypothetical protein